MCNLAPPDMVGHTGVYDAAVKACEVTGNVLSLSSHVPLLISHNKYCLFSH